ncbi:formylglycine-generating enzyme family protein [Massilia sp. CCM 9210]|uniref:formylglycine-generating enzyme family protein n=1 Tax=Massilia scottii TaxID=3057166 RepID=UPI002796B075|nr:formylglycine-generating enzyme family protein [Massilia sp. CCM 9210]MDQ1811810.1 formylglycine-generating enzyme family protein [Massilia sp. CCM 9210]
MKHHLTTFACAAMLCGTAGAGEYVALPGAELRSVMPADGKEAPAIVAPFSMRATAVTNAEFRAFVLAHPQWQRGQAPAVLAAPTYLAAWRGAADHGTLAPDAPVTNVSWHAANAFCASEGARLPRWYEWEYAAAANATRADAREDPQWLEHILNWYAHPASTPPSRVRASAPNYYGLYDMHGLVWEWVEDYSALFVSADSRSQDPRKVLDYCGGAALSLGDRRNYAVLMRIALLAAMEGAQDGGYLGFRCARGDASHTPTPRQSP